MFTLYTSPAGLFGTTDLQVNDLVESINGINFVDNPDLHEALSLVQAAPSIVTLVVQAHSKKVDKECNV